MNGLLKKLEENLRLKNYSKETIKSYLFYRKFLLETYGISGEWDFIIIICNIGM